jgi:ABC-type phosphate transport system substrate-binding protein
MKRLPDLLQHRRLRNETRRIAGVVGLIAALTVSLAACKDGDSTDVATSATPAATALLASAAAMSTADVPPPPVIQSVGSTTAAPVAGAASADLASVHAQLETTLANAAACSADTDCHSVAVGAKACGGPTGYRAFSGKNVDPASVQALAEHEHDLAAAAARESHQVSPCFMLADPGARCQKNQCVTGRPGSP